MRYHHGNLREALIEAGMATAREHGPQAVEVRAVTRAAGVSPTAAYRHFADRDELLQAVAGRCQRRLAALMRQRLATLESAPSPAGGGRSGTDTSTLRSPAQAWQRLRAAGHAYVEFALTEPGWFRTAFAAPIPARSREDRSAFQVLVDALDDLVASGAIPATSRPGAEYIAWSAAHGIASLLISGSLRDLPPAARDHIIDQVIHAVAF